MKKKDDDDTVPWNINNRKQMMFKFKALILPAAASVWEPSGRLREPRASHAGPRDQQHLPPQHQEGIHR